MTTRVEAGTHTLDPISRFLRTPKGTVMLVLAFFSVLAVPVQGVGQALPGLVAATAVAALADVAIFQLRKQVWVFPSGAILTGMIIALVLRAGEPLYVPIFAAVLAIVSKHVLQTRWSNIFNPAALALVASSLIFASGQSWWGALPDLGPIGLIVLMVAGIYVADRINKLPLVLAFLGVYFLLFTVGSFTMDPVRVAEIFRSPDLQAVLLFAFFMLDDPPTCPIRYGDQILFGIIAAVGSYAVFVMNGGVYYLLVGLLVANAWESFRRLLFQKKPLDRGKSIAAAK